MDLLSEFLEFARALVESGKYVGLNVPSTSAGRFTMRLSALMISGSISATSLLRG